MKLKNALKKIIHSVCLISVLFLSVFFVLPPVESHAEDYFTITIVNNSYWDNNDFTLIYGTYRFDKRINYNESYTINVPVSAGDHIYTYCHHRGSTLDWYFKLTFTPPPVNNTYAFEDFPITISWTDDDQYNTFLAYSINVNAPLPTPTPTPTPAPSSPTPNANAEAFFGKLGDDAQNGVGAILTAWNAASSHFYTGVLFIVIPVFLGIVSLIASFFFGGGDDD